MDDACIVLLCSGRGRGVVSGTVLSQVVLFLASRLT